jgi:hypothetical protein
MDTGRFHTVSVRIYPLSCLIIPVPLDAGVPPDDRAPWTPLRGSLTPAQGEMLLRHTLVSLDVAEQVRALARGAFTGADVGGEREEEAPPDTTVGIDRWRTARCTGGRAYWW